MSISTAAIPRSLVLITRAPLFVGSKVNVERVWFSTEHFSFSNFNCLSLPPSISDRTLTLCKAVRESFRGIKMTTQVFVPWFQQIDPNKESQPCLARSNTVARQKPNWRSRREREVFWRKSQDGPKWTYHSPFVLSSKALHPKCCEFFSFQSGHSHPELNNSEEKTRTDFCFKPSFSVCQGAFLAESGQCLTFDHYLLVSKNVFLCVFDMLLSVLSPSTSFLDSLS